MKKLIVFDLDGTLAPSKSPMDSEMAGLLKSLLGIAKVAIISGGDWSQFEEQVVGPLDHGHDVKDLSILPTCGTKFYKFESGWKQVYSQDLKPDEKSKILGALTEARKELSMEPPKTWGDVVQDRGTQITFSALGQQAPLEEKKKWDPDFAKRKKLQAILQKLIPEFSVNLGGTTSVDITRLGVDKGFGIHKLKEQLGIDLDEMIFVGDAIFPGGNDYPAKQVGVVSIEVGGPEGTKGVIQAIIACLSDCVSD